MKKVILMLTAAALIASCTKTEIYDMPDGEGQGATIQAKSNHNGVTASATRKPFEGAIASDNQLTARVLTFRAGADGDLWSNGTMTFADDGIVAYNAGATRTKFGADLTETYGTYGFYPETATDWTVTGAAKDVATIAYTFTGKEDVMVAAEVGTLPTYKVATEYTALTFDHQLTKLVIKINAKDTDADTEWVTLDDVRLIKTNGTADELKNTFTYTFDGGTGAFSNPVASFAFFGYDATYKCIDDLYTVGTAANIVYEADPADLNPVAYSMVPPFAINGDGAAADTNYEVTLSVDATSVSGARTNIEVPVNLTNPGASVSSKGYAYEITLTFDMNIIKAKATVTEWEAGDDSDDNIIV